MQMNMTGVDFDYGSVLVQLKPQITDAVSMCSDPFEELNISDAKCIFGDDASSISLFSDKTEPIIYVILIWKIRAVKML